MSAPATISHANRSHFTASVSVPTRGVPVPTMLPMTPNLRSSLHGGTRYGREERGRWSIAGVERAKCVGLQRSTRRKILFGYYFRWMMFQRSVREARFSTYLRTKLDQAEALPPQSLNASTDNLLDSAKAELYNTARQSILEEELPKYQCVIQDLQKELTTRDTEQEEIEQLKRQLEEAATKREESTSARKNEQGEVERLKLELEDAGSARKNEQKTIKKLEKELEKAKSKQGEVEKLKQELKEALTVKKELEEANTALSQDLETKSADTIRQAMVIEVKGLEETVEAMEGEIESLQKEKKSMRAKIEKEVKRSLRPVVENEIEADLRAKIEKEIELFTPEIKEALKTEIEKKLRPKIASELREEAGHDSRRLVMQNTSLLHTLSALRLLFPYWTILHKHAWMKKPRFPEGDVSKSSCLSTISKDSSDP